MEVIKGADAPMSLQLIKSDLTYGSGGTVSYSIYSASGTTIFSGQTTAWNTTYNSYFDELNVASVWPTQTVGNYSLVWAVSGVTADFATKYTEPLTVVPTSPDYLIVEGSYTMSDVHRIMLAVLAGSSSGGGTGTNIYTDTSGTTDRITASVDSRGNRNSVVIDAT